MLQCLQKNSDLLTIFLTCQEHRIPMGRAPCANKRYAHSTRVDVTPNAEHIFIGASARTADVLTLANVMQTQTEHPHHQKQDVLQALRPLSERPDPCIP